MNKLIYFSVLAFTFLYSTETFNTFTVFATTNVAGETEPCGWKKKPLGGLARKSAVLNDAKNENSNYFVVDAGDLFFKKSTINPGIPVDLAKISAETIVNAFNEIGCDAFNVGKKDFALGLDYLIYLKELSDFPYISANIKNTTGSYLFNPYKIVNKNGLKLGMIGLSSVFELEGIKVDDPIESLKKIVDFVNTQSDFVVLLFNAIDQDMNRFHNEDLAVDFVIQSKSKKRSNDGGKKDIPVYSCGDRGKYVYEFDFTYNDLGNDFVDVAYLESTIKLINRKIQNLSKNEDVTQDVIANQKKIEDYKAQLIKAEQKINLAENKILVKKIELGKKIIDDPEILKIVDNANKKKSVFGPLPENPPHGHPGHVH